jgi:hypothetical protein
MRIQSIALLLPFLAPACTEYVIHDDDGGIGNYDTSAVPDIVVDPTEIYFGDVSVSADGSSSETVTVSNIGSKDLFIQGLSLDSADGPFSISAIQSVLVPPDASTQFEVVFEPNSGSETTGTVFIDSDDPDTPTVEVALYGTGISPVIDVDPIEYDFGTLYIGCEVEQTVKISNIGSEDLIVDEFSFTTASVELDIDNNDDAWDAIGWTLAPGESAEVFVQYYPIDDYSDIAYLSITSNDPFTPTAMSTLMGLGELFDENIDVFEQPIEGLTDIIFALDRSCSMDADLANIQTNFDVFVETLAGMDADFQVAAVVDDDGCVLGSDIWIDNTFSEDDAKDTLENMMNLAGTYGSNTERAFMLLEAAVTEDNIGSGGCNEDLVRDDAKLNLVGVSDEREQSVNSWEYYVGVFQDLKDDTDQLVVHAIGGDYGTGCGGTAEPYTGMYEATVATGGTFLSICAEDFGAHLEALAEGSTADLSAFTLTDSPVQETIEVRVDGVTKTQGWEYDTSDNQVVFEEDYIPEGGATVEIEYALFGDCDG